MFTVRYDATIAATTPSPSQTMARRAARLPRRPRKDALYAIAPTQVLTPACVPPIAVGSLPEDPALPHRRCSFPSWVFSTTERHLRGKVLVSTRAPRLARSTLVVYHAIPANRRVACPVAALPVATELGPINGASNAYSAQRILPVGHKSPPAVYHMACTGFSNCHRPTPPPLSLSLPSSCSLCILLHTSCLA